ncbi:MAG TPA: hypothetical protein VLE22_13490 [Bryobacteraceae bacterium]|jgi:hypothetical protein|nr:hypothetical protein [Bryobacteraceae bacterium]
MWDLRTPSGWFFVILGVILCAVGIVSPGARAPLTDVNVNLYAGISMLLFGGILLWMARRAS